MPRLGALLGLCAALIFSAFWIVRPGTPSVFEDPQALPGPLEPTDWFFVQRAYPRTEIDPAAFREALGQAQVLRANAQRRGDAPWEPAGATNIGGRVSSLAAESFDVFYVGTASGGIMKTTDGGQSFVSLGDDVLSLSIGDVALDPQDPSTVYAGTGESNGGGGSLTYGGQGVFQSPDGGASWTHLGLEETGTIGRIIVDPTDSQTLFVAAAGKLFASDEHRGVYRTTDGGQSWDKTLFVNDSTGAIDVAINPRSPDTLYAATWERRRRADDRHYGGEGSGIHRSIDGGATWTRLSVGLPSGANVGRIGISVAASRPNVVYAIYADATGNPLAVYRTQDGGDNWTIRGGFSGPSFCWWFGQIRADPTDAEVVYIPVLSLYKSGDGGASFNFASGSMHVDQHALWIDPSNPNQLIAGNDGGVYRSTSGGSSWAKAPGPFPATQFYTVEIDESVPERLYGGTQDNGTNRTLTGNLDDWQSIYGGDGFVVLVDPSNNQYVYAESQYGGLGRSTNGGSSFTGATSGVSGRKNWNMPYVFEPGNPETLYLGTDRVFKSTNRAQSWTPISPDLTGGPTNGSLVFGTITTLDVSPANVQTIWVGTDDGHVQVTHDGGASWADVSAGLPNRWITRVTPHPTEFQDAFVTVSGYRWGEDMAYVYLTQDGGQTWSPRTNGLPNAPVNDLLYDPQDSNRLYLSSDVGVFTSPDGGDTWQALGTGLPQAPVLDLDLHNGTRSLVAGTFGRSMYRYDLTQLPTASEGRPGTVSLDLEVGPNPSSGAVTFRFGLDESQAVTLSVFDLQGRRVAVLARREFGPGRHDVRWDAPSGLAAGTYIARLAVERGSTRTVQLTRSR